MSWINHLPPACWSTFWKSNFKQQSGCRFDIMDNESYFFVFWHMHLYMSWYIRSFFGFTFLNILYFFKCSCTNIFHRRSLYTFYMLYNIYTHTICDVIQYDTILYDMIWHMICIMVRHESTYVISFLTWHNESINDYKNDELYTSPRVSLALFSFCWWRHNWLLMTS